MTRAWAVFALCIGASSACAQTVTGFTDRRGATLADVAMTDDAGTSMWMHDFVGRPFFLAFAYHTCPQLCGLVLGEFTAALRELPARVGTEFDVVVVSIDPADTPSISAAAKSRYVARYGSAGAGWHFLVGNADSVRRLTASAGFDYVYDPIQKTFTHPAGVLYVDANERIIGHREATGFTPASLQRLIDGDGDGASPAWNRLCGALGFGGGDKTASTLTVLRCVAFGSLFAIGALLWRRQRRLR